LFVVSNSISTKCKKGNPIAFAISNHGDKSSIDVIHATGRLPTSQTKKKSSLEFPQHVSNKQAEIVFFFMIEDLDEGFFAVLGMCTIWSEAFS
jgi:hypothetical protein